MLGLQTQTQQLALLEDKLPGKPAQVGIVGLGYVGLPPAVVFANTGFHVTGIDVKTARWPPSMQRTQALQEREYYQAEEC